METNSGDLFDGEEWMTDDCEICLVSFGVSGRAAQNVAQTMRKEGALVGHVRLRTVWPFPEDYMGELSRSCKAFVVPEMNLGQLRLEVERTAAGRAKVFGVNNVSGSMITTHEIYEAMRGLV